jgi:hypothetical protein
LALVLTTVGFVTRTVHGFEPISTLSVGVAVIGAATFAGYQSVKCRLYECCSFDGTNTTWYKNSDEDFIKMRRTFLDKVYGQHLVRTIVTKAVKAHVQDKKPKKALVMTFHGWTGGGKNYVSQILAETLYKKGVDSQFVHLLSSTKEWPDHNKLTEYKSLLQKRVEAAVKSCPRQLFIFDEVDKMPQGLLEALVPFLDYNPHVRGIDFRHCIFIFLSNTGGYAISRTVYNFWSQGKERSSIGMKDIEPLINSGAFNERGGLHKSSVVANHLIDHYIPFLPLEKKHVMQCVEDFVEQRYPGKIVNKEFLEKVANEMEYFPPDVNLYSKTGCKRVEKKVDVLIE